MERGDRYSPSLRTLSSSVFYVPTVNHTRIQAGLFSAVVTAFNIEAYKFLQDDPSQASVLLLQQISQQLSQLPANLRAENATLGSSASTKPLNAGPSIQTIRINALWFSSLVCALFSALIGIMVKQWLREYMAVVSLSSRDHVRLRQHRYEGLVSWHVPEIMAFLPILLELSLILFFIGLIDFLFMLQVTVAAIVTSLIVLALLFYGATTISPLLSSHCPFKSPQSWALVRVHKRATKWILRLRSQAASTAHSFIATPTPSYFAHWGERDNNTVRSFQDELDLKAITWIRTTFVDDVTQDSLVSVLPSLREDNAAILVFDTLAQAMNIHTPILFNLIRTRSCVDMLREIGASLDHRTRKRIVNMHLKLLEYIPRHSDPSNIGTLDVLWTLWELCLGACNAEHQDPLMYRSVLNGLAELLREDEPFRLRRGALNLLYESTHAWTYLYCPSGKLS